MERSIAMYKPICVCIFLSIGLTTALAQAGVRGGDISDRQSIEQDNQARRVALRNALQSQRNAGSASHLGTRAERELSAKERGELRQQLRQQRRESAK